MGGGGIQSNCKISRAACRKLEMIREEEVGVGAWSRSTEVGGSFGEFRSRQVERLRMGKRQAVEKVKFRVVKGWEN